MIKLLPLVLTVMGVAHADQRRTNLYVPPHVSRVGEVEVNLSEITRDFESKFKLISAHFRDDKNELRLIYANNSALAGLSLAKPSYKDGAIFYKVCYQATRDEAFSASLIPESRPAVRQIMIHDTAKYSKYGGWGYAVYNDQGAALSGDRVATNTTCFACHQIVKNREYIFSRKLAGLSVWDKTNSPTFSKSDQSLRKELFAFKTEDFSALNPELRKLIRPAGDKVNLMAGKIMDKKFTGYVAELGAFLAKKTTENGWPSLAFTESEGEIIFKYSYIDKDPGYACPPENAVRIGGGAIVARTRTVLLSELSKCWRK